VISDGDLRRLLEKSPDPLSLPAAQAMTAEPKTIGAAELASAALAKMEALKITSLVAVDGEAADGGGRSSVAGIIHLHDLWRTELF